MENEQTPGLTAPLLVSAPAADSGLLRRAVERWKKAAHAIGVVQTRILMVVFYVLAVLPVGLVFRSLRDPLHLKEPAQTNWTPCQQEPPSLEHSRQQF